MKTITLIARESELDSKLKKKAPEQRKSVNKPVMAAALLLFLAVLCLPLYAETGSAGVDTAFDRNIIIAFAGIFLLGLALNLTPCVYPMLAITVSIFSGQSESRPGVVAGRALIYVLGIAVMYSSLGVAAALTGGLFGGILQSRAVLIFIGLLFLLLSLSMFGLYELRPPSRLMNLFGGRRSPGAAGVFISGLFVGIFAAPCIGPPVIGLLAMVGQRGDPLFGFMTFFVLSLGLGFPYLLLGTFSGLMKKLPGSGEWMIWVRKLMGVLLVCVGIFYLSLALHPGLVFILIPAGIASGGVYLGFIDRSGRGSSRFLWFQRAFGAGLILLAILLFYSGRLPSLDWDDYSAEKFSPRPGEPALIYFTADWCVPCLEMGRRTFTDEKLIRRMNDLVRAKVDLTHYDSPESLELRRRFGIAGVPTILFLDGDKEIRSRRVTGSVSAEELLSRISIAERIIAAGGPYGDDAAEALNQELSELRLVSDSTWIRPGEPFRLGALFLIRDQWHIYWINPGDSGAAPDIEWVVPPGFDAGDINRPAPMSFEYSSLVTFGHEDELLLSRKVVPPADTGRGEKIVFRVEGSWMLCRGSTCVIQSGEAELTLEVRDEPPRRSGYRIRFEDADAMVPARDPDWSFSAELDENYLILELIPPAGISPRIIRGSEFFPGRSGVVSSKRYEWRRKGERYIMKMKREESDPGEIFTGVLLLPEGRTPRVLKVEAPLF